MRGFFFKKLFLFFLCVTFISTPFLVFSQEVSAPNEAPAETSDSESSSENLTENTESTSEETTQDTSSGSENSAGDQSYFIDNTKPEGERVVESASSDLINPSYVEQHKEISTDTVPETPEVLGETTTPEPQEEPQAPTPEPTPEPEPTPAPIPVEEKPIQEEIPLSELTRVYDKEIFVNKDAKHECKAEFFRVDMSERSSALNTIQFTKEANISYEMEIGSLPIGVDIRFSESNSYHKNLGSEDESIDISITKESDAPKGDFSVPIIYTQKGVFDSSVICQLNIVNL